MTKAKLYHCHDARSFRCVWAAAAAGIDYDLETMRFPPRVYVPEYKQINPLGTIPGWVDGDMVLTESAAICQIMARGTALEVRPDEADYPAYLNWLHRSDATLTFPLAIMLRYSRFAAPEGQRPDVVEDYKLFFLGRARAIESALADGREWLIADRFTIADICVGYAVMLAGTLGCDTELGEATRRWWDRLAATPSFLAAKQRQRDSLPQ
jgi:glutathione S-transferase